MLALEKENIDARAFIEGIMSVLYQIIQSLIISKILKIKKHIPMK